MRLFNGWFSIEANVSEPEPEAYVSIRVIAEGDSYEEVINDIIAKVQSAFLQDVPAKNVRIPFSLQLQESFSGKKWTTGANYVKVLVPRYEA